MGVSVGRYCIYNNSIYSNELIVEHRRFLDIYGDPKYVYDPLNRMVSVSSSSGAGTNYFYDAVGNRDSVHNGNGTSTGYTYDNLNRLVNVTNYSPTDEVISSYTYTLNNAGIRTAVTEYDGSRVDYGYDDLYRLTGEVRTGSHAYAIAYTYDNVGNRLTQTKNGVPIAYTYNNRDQLTVEDSAGVVTTYTYDNAGRMVTKTNAGGTTTYAWIDNDRMASVAAPGNTTTYEYNADGLRVKTNDGMGAKWYLYDMHLPYGQVVAEYQGNGSLTASYGFGLDRISMRRGGTTYTYLADGQGSVRQLTNSSGTVTDTYDYYAFGEVLNRTGTTQNEFTYTGEQFDPNAGFYYLRARWYDPARGRFASVDPEDGCIECGLSQHKYLYANASPISKRDPTGRFVLTEVISTITISNILASNAIPATSTHGCNPISFTMIIHGWHGGFTEGTGNINLMVQFDLYIRGDQKDCVIDQDMKGESRIAGVTIQNYPNWVSDPIDGRDWWTGNNWNIQYRNWISPHHARFLDAPGFLDVTPLSFPLYKGGVGGNGFYEYRTNVKEKSTGAIRKSILWGIFIDYSTESDGEVYFDF